MESGYNPITLSSKGGEIEYLQQVNSLPASGLSQINKGVSIAEAESLLLLFCPRACLTGHTQPTGAWRNRLLTSATVTSEEVGKGSQQGSQNRKPSCCQ